MGHISGYSWRVTTLWAQVQLVTSSSCVRQLTPTEVTGRLDSSDIAARWPQRKEGGVSTLEGPCAVEALVLLSQALRTDCGQNRAPGFSRKLENKLACRVRGQSEMSSWGELWDRGRKGAVSRWSVQVLSSVSSVMATSPSVVTCICLMLEVQKALPEKFLRSSQPSCGASMGMRPGQALTSLPVRTEHWVCHQEAPASPCRAIEPQFQVHPL